jgi:peptide/nickel transport system permease protein
VSDAALRLAAEPLPGGREGRRRSINLAIGMAASALLVGVALLSLVWTPYPPRAIDIVHRLAHPSLAHPLGTDAFGRDELSMLMAGARNSIVVAVVAVAVGAGFGVPLGLIAAARRGWIDDLVMRFTDLAFAFPALLTAVIITAIAGPGAVNAMLAIGIFNVPVFARLTRGAALPLWKREFVLAARAAGRGDAAISLDHILPNVAAVLIVQATIQFALAIVAEAGLSYVGLGSLPSEPSWGKMLNDAQTYIYAAPLLAVFPGLAITVSVLGLNLFGDGLRDVLDPRVRRERG